MKRRSAMALVGVLGSVLVATSALAGVNYIKYNEEFRAQKESSASGAEGGKYMHRSKYQREQQETGNTLPTTDRDLNKPAGKHDRPEWAPGK